MKAPPTQGLWGKGFLGDQSVVWITSVWGGLSKILWKPITFKVSQIGHLKAKRLPSQSGKQWPGRLHPSVQIHHNPITPADFAIICRFSQPSSSKQIQPTLHKRVITSQRVPQPDKLPPKPGGEVGSMVGSQDGHNTAPSCGRLGLQPPKPHHPHLPGVIITPLGGNNPDDFTALL